MPGTARAVEIDQEECAVPAEDAAAYLSRHGIHAEIIRWPDGQVAELGGDLAEQRVGHR